MMIIIIIKMNYEALNESSTTSQSGDDKTEITPPPKKWNTKKKGKIEQ